MGFLFVGYPVTSCTTQSFLSSYELFLIDNDLSTADRCRL